MVRFITRPLRKTNCFSCLRKLSGQKFPQGDGRIQAIYRFQRCIGVFPTFRNRIDETNGFEVKQIYAIKVVYKPTDGEDIIDGITAYPLFDPSQESY